MEDAAVIYLTGLHHTVGRLAGNNHLRAIGIRDSIPGLCTCTPPKCTERTDLGAIIAAPGEISGLAIAALVEFAAKENLPIRFKYYDRGWKWTEFNPERDKVQEFKQRSMIMFGALNIIDNTTEVGISNAESGDFIMSKWSNTLGHTRVIYSVTPIGSKFKVVWYQGNLPPVKPEKRVDFFSNIDGVYDEKPRKWNFEQFEL